MTDESCDSALRFLSSPDNHSDSTSLPYRTNMSATKEHRKSVAFSDGATIVASDGEVSHEQVNGVAKEPSAESHSAGTEPSFRLFHHCNSQHTVNGDSQPSDPAIDEVSDLLKSLGKKKKSKKPKEEPGDGGDEQAPAPDAEFDPTTLKKKKKKKPAKAETDDFEAQLAKRGVGPEAEADLNGDAATQPDAVEGDMDTGTGVWSHDETGPIRYDKLLERFFAHLHGEYHIDHDLVSVLT